MSMLLRFNFFITRKSSIDAMYAGGMEQFRADWLAPRRRRRKSAEEEDMPTGEDEHLVGFTSMGWYYKDVVDVLIASGLQHQREGHVIDIAFGNQADGVEERCDWLESAELPDGQTIVWLKGAGRGEVVEPFFR